MFKPLAVLRELPRLLGNTVAACRAEILDWMQQERGLHIGPIDRDLCLASADAPDAVICMYGAAAVVNDRLVITASEHAIIEGLIAVHA